MYNFNENINTKSFDVHFHENKIRNRLMYFFHKNKNTKSFDVHFHENSRNTNAQGERQSALLPMPNQIRLIILAAGNSLRTLS